MKLDLGKITEAILESYRTTGGLNNEDDTNLPHPWQGRLRFAPLDAGKLAARWQLEKGRGTGTQADTEDAAATTGQRTCGT